MRLRYGINPQQRFASAEPVVPGTHPVQVLNGTPSMINLLDALNAWQLVQEAKAATGLPAAASFKHLSPAGAALATELPDDLAHAYEVQGTTLSSPALAYVRARGADPKSSYGDLAALSDPVDPPTATILKGVVSDGVIAPGYHPAALELLKTKKQGAYLILRADPDFQPPPRQAREVFGMRLVQDRDPHPIGPADLDQTVVGTLDQPARRDLLLGPVTMKYTQSNSVGYALDAQMIGIGAGQQSRVDCTKLAGAKADLWWLGRHPKALALRFHQGLSRQQRVNWRVRYLEGDLSPTEARDLQACLDSPIDPLTDQERAAWLARLDQVSMVSDGYLPFPDNVDHARRHGVRFIAAPAGSIRDPQVADACRQHQIALVHTPHRYFHH